jgi:dihydrolipoamide dehydrogenase
MIACDVVVIGTGPGGYVAAIRAAQLGAKTVVVEREEIGGVCLNWGCIPTKTFIYTAGLYHKMREAGEYGLTVKDVQVDMKALIKRKQGVIRRNQSGINGLFKANGIQVVTGDARVTAPGKVRVGAEEIQAKSIIVATGSSPAQIPGLGTDGKHILDSTDALDLETIPKKAVIIGAGAIGAEFACIWNAFGTEVTLVEMMPQVLPLADTEIANMLEKILIKRKMDVRTATKVAKLDQSKKGVHVTFEGKSTAPVDADVVLVGIGRKLHSEVVSETPGLGVKLDRRGAIEVNDRMETSVPGIFAIGDVTGKTMLAHGASAEGLVAAANAVGKARRMDYRVVPACTFTAPEVANVGLTETQAREAGIDVKVGRFPFAASGRAATMNETEGMVKIVGDAATDEVVGVHIMGAEAGELIAAPAVAMYMEATVAEIAHTIHTHPTMAEAVMEAAEDYFGIGVHTPPRR